MRSLWRTPPPVDCVPDRDKHNKCVSGNAVYTETFAYNEQNYIINYIIKEGIVYISEPCLVNIIGNPIDSFNVPNSTVTEGNAIYLNRLQSIAYVNTSSNEGLEEALISFLGHL